VDANKFLEDLNCLIDSEKQAGNKNSESTEDDPKNSLQIPSSKSKLKSDTKTKYSTSDTYVQKEMTEETDTDQLEKSSSTINKSKLIQEIMKERQKASENENKRIQDAIAKAPYACQSILKVLHRHNIEIPKKITMNNKTEFQELAESATRLPRTGNKHGRKSGFGHENRHRKATE
jgi:hypothetical protein